MKRIHDFNPRPCVRATKKRLNQHYTSGTPFIFDYSPKQMVESIINLTP